METYFFHVYMSTICIIRKFHGLTDSYIVQCSLLVNFEHFQILRAIGRGSFGKVFWPQWTHMLHIVCTTNVLITIFVHKHRFALCRNVIPAVDLPWSTSVEVHALVRKHWVVCWRRWNCCRRWSTRFSSTCGFHFKVKRHISRTWIACIVPYLTCNMFNHIQHVAYGIIATTGTADEEDLFMVSDLLAGGDLRYHLQKEVYENET